MRRLGQSANFAKVGILHGLNRTMDRARTEYVKDSDIMATGPEKSIPECRRILSPTFRMLTLMMIYSYISLVEYIIIIIKREKKTYSGGGSWWRSDEEGWSSKLFEGQFQLHITWPCLFQLPRRPPDDATTATMPPTQGSFFSVLH